MGFRAIDLEAEGRKGVGAADDGLGFRPVYPYSGDSEVVVVSQAFLDNRVEPGVAESFPPAGVARGGAIVNISSGAGRFGIRGLLPYCVAKGGLEALTRAMAQELAPRIRVNAIALGAFMTTGLQSSFDLMPGSEEQLKARTPLHRVGDVEDLGRLALYLSTRDCYATNSVFAVDGGLQGPNSELPIPDL